MSKHVPALVGPDWLAQHLDDNNLILLDATVLSIPRSGVGVEWISGRASFENEHIGGALFADVLEDFSAPRSNPDDLVFTLPGADRFQEAARRLGIGPQSSVIVYDTTTLAFAARLWWLFRYFGHDQIAVLDGGLQAWVAAGGRTEFGPEARTETGTLHAEIRSGFFTSRDEVLAVVEGTRPGTLVCALPPEDPDVDRSFRGRPGRIPGSVTIPAVGLRDPATGTLTSGSHFDGIDPDRGVVIVYCGGGIAASLDAFALTLLGFEDVQVYDGSLNEWVLDENAPLTTSAEP